MSHPTQWSVLLARGKKALRMPPRQLLGRLRDEARQQTKRPWARTYPWMLSDRTLLGRSDASSLDSLWDQVASRRTFFLRPDDRIQWSAAFRERFPEDVPRIIAAADAVLRHEFDLLGSGPVRLGADLPWHADFKTGRVWPLRYCRDIEYLELDRPSDVKVPWELSRAQHFTTLGQAWWLTGDDAYSEEFVREVDDWIARNPLAYGVNWACAMDVALRAVSWIWGFCFMAESAACREPKFRERFLRTLFTHGEFIVRNLETSDVNGNHYLSDAIGLVFVGAFFKHTESGAAWLERGRLIVADEILLQVTSDGVDFEGSTPYHRLVLELFLTAYLLLERNGEHVPASCWDRLARMLDFVAAYTKPDGLAPLIGDADDGRVQKLGGQRMNDHRYLLATGATRLSRPDLKAAAGRFWEESFWLTGPEGAAAFDALPVIEPPDRSAAFPEGGFFVLRNPATHLIVDCGEVGMRGRGGHGHNDSLSFELYMAGMNVITDCGAFVYTASREWRNRFRGTAFHNTIQVDGEELNRFVGDDALWQLAYDAVPDGVTWDFGAAGGPDGSFWRGSHLGYRRLPSPAQPSRAIWVHPDRPIVAMRDTVEGSGAHRLVWRWHMDPACDVSADGADFRIRHRAGAAPQVWMLPASPEPALRIETGWVSTAYGVKTETQVVVLETDRALPYTFGCVFADVRLDEEARVKALNLCVRSS